MSRKTYTSANTIEQLVHDVNQQTLSMHMHRPDVLFQYSIDALQMNIESRMVLETLKEMADLRRNDPKAYALLTNEHLCDMCNTIHVDGDLCDPTTCEHDYDSDKADDGWMVCIYCHDEQPDDYDGDDY